MKIVAMLALFLLVHTVSALDQPVRVLLDDNYPPYSFRTLEGEVQGILIDLWNEWSAITGRKVELRALPWSEVLKEMEAGNGDVIDTFFYTSERATRYLYSAPYASIDVPVFFHRSISGINAISDLRGFRIAVKEGDACVDVLLKAGVTDLLYYQSYEEIIIAARDLEIRVFCIDKPPATYFLYRYNLDQDYRYTFTLYTGQFHRAVHIGRTALMLQIENGFSRIPLRRIREIERSWLGNTLSPLSDLRYVWTISVVLLFVLFILFLFVLLLRRQVALKTLELKNHLELLAQSERRNKALISALPDLYFIIDSQGNYIDCSHNNRDLLARDPQDLIGRNLSEIDFSVEQVTMFKSVIAEVLSTGRMQVFRYQLAVPAGPCHFEARCVKFDADSVLYLSRDISEQVQYENRILGSLREKEILLKEIHHRVNNNLQVISSLVALQADQYRDDHDRQLMQETHQRIQSMAQLHELLYQSGDFLSLNMEDYIDHVLEELTVSWHEVISRVTLIRDVDQIWFTLQTAMPVALILNELISNAIKYAFTEKGGTLTIRLVQAEGMYRLTVADDGVGMDTVVDFPNVRSLGFLLVYALTQQLGGSVEHDNSHGTMITVLFPGE